MQVLNGLKREIPEGPHRWHSIIICDSLEHISINGEKQGDTRAFTDGELVVNFTEYNQEGCICKFKPQREKDALKNYLETEGALDLRETTKRVREIKTK